MDWYAWLSKTNLDAALVYDYGLTLVRNELQEDDLPYFNHDFLQSIGISVAKHRLEILKLCRKDLGGRPRNGLSRLLLLTRKLFARNVISKLGFHKNSTTRFSPADMSPYRNQWSGALRRIGGGNESQLGGRNMIWSGPLDRRLQEKLMAAGRCQSVSGPLDVKMHERLLYPNWSPMVGNGKPSERSGLACRSPNVSGPIERLGLSPKVGYCRSEMIGDDHDGAQSLWSIMFQDMKPT